MTAMVLACRVSIAYLLSVLPSLASLATTRKAPGKCWRVYTGAVVAGEICTMLFQVIAVFAQGKGTAIFGLGKAEKPSTGAQMRQLLRDRARDDVLDGLLQAGAQLGGQARHHVVEHRRHAGAHLLLERQFD